MFRHLLLGLLRQGAPQHGYALMKEYNVRAASRVSAGNVYRELQRLNACGLVCEAVNPAAADPRRLPYQITDAGRAAVDAWLGDTTASAVRFPEDELSARTMFVEDLDSRAAMRLIEHWRSELLSLQESVGRACEKIRIADAAMGANGMRSRALLLARRLKHIAADLEFVDELAAAYHAAQQPQSRQKMDAGAVLGRQPTGQARRPPLGAQRRTTTGRSGDARRARAC